MTFIVAYITYKSMEEAEKVSSSLLADKIVGCVNYFPIKSTFWWQGDITNEDEIVALVKTRQENWEKLKNEVLRIHPYDVPCIMKFEVEANQEYEDWINSATK